MDELSHHPWLQFPQGTIARNRRDRLVRKEMGQQKAIDYDLLAELGQLERMTAIIGEDTPWSRLFEMTFAPQYRLITVEFLSTFVFRPRAADQPQADPDKPEERGLIFSGVYVTRLARANELIDMESAGMQAFAPVRLDKRTVQGMRVMQKFRRVGLRFSLQKGVIWLRGPNDLHYRDEDPMPQPQQ
ncbi:hypothetical protein R6Q57_014353 [Mikania cordata]